MATEIDYYITMVSKIASFVNAVGSSINFSAHGWWGKEKNNVAAKISVRPRKNMAEGGCGRNSAVFLQKIEASPAALLIESRTQQKSFGIIQLILLIISALIDEKYPKDHYLSAFFGEYIFSAQAFRMSHDDTHELCGEITPNTL